MMRRTNQFERTDRDITYALFEIMETKSFEKITVQNILDEARINRSTFYQHFSDKYEILERAQETIVSEMIDMITVTTKENDMSLETINMLLYEYIVSKKEIILRLFSIKTEEFNLKEKMIDLYTQQLIKDSKTLSKAEARLTAVMIVELLEDYLKNNNTDKEFAQYMLNTFLHITTYFFRVDHVKNAEELILDTVAKIRHSQ
ncbi:MAG: TetR family transcriptional regulator [Lachnospiraceae bacterium]|nr:TetR family transcriptional regulator [Lachnospiraceae bacterium]